MINVFTGMIAMVLLLALFLHGTEPKNKKYILLSCLLMFCVLGLRDATQIGNDSRTSYLWGFYRANSQDWSSLFESFSMEHNSGFYIFVKAMNVLTGNDYQLYTTLISAFMMAVFGVFIYRFSTSPVQSFCYYWGLLLYMFMFSATKQALAMTVLLLAFGAVIDKKPIKFILLVFLAAQFHFPAMIFLPAYWIAKIKPGRHFLFLIVGLLIVTYLLRDQILTIMMRAYEDETESGEYSLEGARFLSNKALIMLGIVIVALLLRRPSTEERTYSILLEFTAVAVVFQTFCAYSNIFERLADYYFQFSVVLIPMVFEQRSDAQSILSKRLDYTVKSIVPYLFSAFGVWRFATTVVADGHFIPYRFYFQ